MSDNSRAFDPVLKGFDSSVRPSDVVWYDFEDGVSRMKKVARRSRIPVVMFIDGACRGNGTSYARAAFGVNIGGPDSAHNSNGLLPPWESHSSQAAEIYAAKRAVEIAQNDLGEAVCQDGVVIVTDSSYLFEAMTGHIYNWVDNGFLNAKGGPVVNGDAFLDLHQKIEEWEGIGIMTRFWKVPRKFNQDADHLARAAL